MMLNSEYAELSHRHHICQYLKFINYGVLAFDL